MEVQNTETKRSFRKTLWGRCHLLSERSVSSFRFTICIVRRTVRKVSLYEDLFNFFNLFSQNYLPLECFLITFMTSELELCETFFVKSGRFLSFCVTSNHLWIICLLPWDLIRCMMLYNINDLLVISMYLKQVDHNMLSPTFLVTLTLCSWFCITISCLTF